MNRRNFLGALLGAAAAARAKLHATPSAAPEVHAPVTPSVPQVTTPLPDHSWYYGPGTHKIRVTVPDHPTFIMSGWIAAAPERLRTCTWCGRGTTQANTRCEGCGANLDRLSSDVRMTPMLRDTEDEDG